VRAYVRDAPPTTTLRSGNRACAPKALPVRRWQARQWQTDTRTGSPLTTAVRRPQLHEAARERSLIVLLLGHAALAGGSEVVATVNVLQALFPIQRSAPIALATAIRHCRRTPRQRVGPKSVAGSLGHFAAKTLTFSAQTVAGAAAGAAGPPTEAMMTIPSRLQSDLEQRSTR
jgi:hypothetical protein